jgi:hypothetical protein
MESKDDHLRWALVAVYGAAQDAQKPKFIAELVIICEEDSLQILVGGDFNIIRRKEEKIMTNPTHGGLFCLMQLLSLVLREKALSERNSYGLTVIQSRHMSS